ncbi:MAG: Type fimbrial biosis protein PilY1, partial [Labilithrix sp.]|nr:Type fimbrial biosis protein PilY1 [Labilithrix sp.]
MRRARLAFATTACAAASVWTVSCATTNEASPDREDGSVTAPGIDGGAPADAGCDAGDSTCPPKPASCEEVDFCPVPLDLDPSYALTSVWGASANDVWAVGSGGTIVHYDGTEWKSVNSPSGVEGETFRAVWGSSATEVWIVASSTKIFHTSRLAAGTAEWTPRPAFTSSDVRGARVYALWGAGPDDIHAGGERTLVFDETAGMFLFANLLRARATDGGPSSWQVSDGIDGRWTQATVHAIWGSSATDVWMSLDNSAEEPWARGSILHGTPGAGGDGALVWTALDSRSTSTLESLSGSSSSDVWAVGAAGTIRRFSAAAERADTFPAPTTETLHRVW